MSLFPGEFISHRNDLMADYLFFGEAFGWTPESINKLGWSFRKEMRETYAEYKKSQMKPSK